MFNYECELCNKPFCTTDEQKNPVCNHCKEAYNISDDYIYGTGEYAKKKEPPAKIEKKKPKPPVGDGKTCVMCGKEHTGKYYVCDTCIYEYNLTDSQLYEMGGLRENPKEESPDETTAASEQKPQPTPSEPKSETKPQALSKKSSISPGATNLDLLTDINEKLDTLIEMQEQNQKHNATTDEAVTDDIVRALWNIAANVATLRNITMFMFVLFLISSVIAILAIASGGH
mgnify:FL=1